MARDGTSTHRSTPPLDVAAVRRHGTPGDHRSPELEHDAMIDLAPFQQLVPLDHGLTVAVTRRADHTLHSTVVNAGVLPHPLSGDPAAAFVSAGGTRKLDHLRADPKFALTIRAGWRWTTVEGNATLIGPDDPDPAVDSERLRTLLRQIFQAAGGTHDDWDTYDRTMRDEPRTAVVVTPSRVYTNPT
jgi:PPOX class probable F420-dependent enzyme